MKRISSRDNATFRRLRLLAHSGRERRKSGRTLLDGAHLLGAYLDSGAVPVLVAVSDSAADGPEVRALLGRGCGAGETLQLADELFGEASPVDSPSGILAVIDIPPAPRAERMAASCVVLDAIQDPGNVGSILRTAAAAGIRDVLLADGCAQAWSPRVLRAGMGAHFRLRLHEHARPAEMLDGFPGIVLAASANEGRAVFDIDLDGHVAWLFGSEGAGLSEAIAGLASVRARIPMPGGAESLNVAAAAAVCLFEQVRQRLAKAAPG